MQDKRREEQVRGGERVEGEGGVGREGGLRRRGGCVCKQPECMRLCGRYVRLCVCVYITPPVCSLTKDRGANLDGRRQDVEKAGREYSQLKLQRDELSNERKSVREMREGVLWC